MPKRRVGNPYHDKLGRFSSAAAASGRTGRSNLDAPDNYPTEGTWESPKGSLLTQVEKVNRPMLREMYAAQNAGGALAERDRGLRYLREHADSKTLLAFDMGFGSPGPGPAPGATVERGRYRGKRTGRRTEPLFPAPARASVNNESSPGGVQVGDVIRTGSYGGIMHDSTMTGKVVNVRPNGTVEYRITSGYRKGDIWTASPGEKVLRLGKGKGGPLSGKV